MKKLRRFRKYWLTIWLVVITISLTTVLSYGAYTGVTTAKRVISLYSHDGILFTSRYLARVLGNPQTILFNYDENKSDEENMPILMVDVCNYDSTDSIYGKNFRFKIKARVVHADGSDISSADWSALGANTPQYSIAFKSYSDTTGDLTTTYLTTPISLTNVDQFIGGSTGTEYQFLAGDKTKYLFETKFDIEDVKTARSTYAVRIEAVVVEDYGDLSNLSGILMAIKSGTTMENKWEGEYGDIITGRAPTVYDGFNYILSGNTSGVLWVTYRSDVVDIDVNDYLSLTMAQTENTVTENGKQYTTLYISVDAETKSRYDLHFYWKAGKNDQVAFDDSFIKAEFH